MRALLLAALPLAVLGQNTDLFNYDETVDGESNYGPRDWENVECEDLDECTGWPEKWHFGVGWSLRRNHCRNCEPGDDCGDHHQSPVALDREWGNNKQLGDDPNSNETVWNCGDNHWMKYESGTCNWEHLKEANAVTVERHALRIGQPIEKFDGSYRLNCLTQGRGRIFSRLDMSGGFSQWWWLNHVEIHTPSEHTQQGKRYAGEVHMGHIYSAPDGPDNGSFNQMATIGVFLDARDDVEPYPFLDKLICQWRHSEDRVREDCGLPSINTTYPGCFQHTRIEEDISTATQRENENARKKRNLRRTVVDHDAHEAEQNVPLDIDPANYRDAEWSEEQWAKFQEEYSRQHPIDSPNRWAKQGERHLIDYDHVPYFNHQFLLDVRTEYYFRYEGTSTYPPCFGKEGSSQGRRHQTNNWRFMKDPIRIHTRQINEMHRLLRDRIGPLGSARNECVSDTAAKVDENGTAWVARPLQELDDSAHENYFCECEDWGSKVPEDNYWCRRADRDKDVRWFEQPYNWAQEGF